MAEDAEARPDEPEDPQAFVVERMRDGADEETIAAELEARGVERSDARHLVATTHAEVTRLVEAERFTPSALVPGIAGGLAAALVGGIVWGLIVAQTEYEIGIAAWGIGFLAGTAVVLFSRGRKGPPLQIVAVVASLLGIVLGKYIAFAYFLKEGVRDEFGAEAAGEVSYFSSDVVRLFFENLGSVFGGFDLLWAALAVFTAWRIPRGLGIALPRSPVRG